MGSSCPISHGRESIRMVKMRRLQLYAGILPYLGSFNRSRPHVATENLEGARSLIPYQRKYQVTAFGQYFVIFPSSGEL